MRKHIGFNILSNWDGGVRFYDTITAIIAIASAVATATSAGVGIYSAVNTDTSSPKLLPGMAPEVDKRAQAAALAEEQALQRKRGAAGTILTGPGGITTTPTTIKTRLGE